MSCSRANAESVVVCGAGAAGMAAALAAARAGATVRLLEASSSPGGTVAHCLIHTLGGLYDGAGNLLNDGLAAELVGRLTGAASSVVPRRMGRVWVLSVCPDIYLAVVQRWLAAEPRIAVQVGTRVSRVVTVAGRVTELEVTGPDGVEQLRTRAVVDATGTADVVRLIDPSLLQAAAVRAAGGLMIRLREVTPGALAFPRGVALVRALRAAADEGTLPPRCAKAWLDNGCVKDEVYVKLFVPLPHDGRDLDRLAVCAREAEREGNAVIAFLRKFPEFARARVDRVGNLGVRDGGRIRGEYYLTAADVRLARKFPDAAGRCSWPIEYWDPEQGVSMEYLADGASYEVPLRALKVQGLANVWAAGKCLSADRLAQASARVAGSCWAMGEAAGRAAASWGMGG